MEELDDPITIEEVESALKLTKNNKAPGPDDIPIETNKGDPLECKNYRGISLMSHIGKLYERILERRLRQKAESLLSESQRGFRPGRGPVDQIAALRIFLEKSWEYSIEQHICFLDLEKAFNRIPRGKMWKVIGETGISNRLLKAIRSTYENQRSTVLGGTTYFETNTSVCQGSVLSPLLFIIYFNHTIQNIERKDFEIERFGYADDIAQTRNSTRKLQRVMTQWDQELTTAGLKLSYKKTEYMRPLFMTSSHCGSGMNAFLFILSCSFVTGQIRYSIPEETKKGSLIGNVAQDLGLDLKRLQTGRARIATGESMQYSELKPDKGTLVVKERIDREELCGDITPCSFSFEIILDNPIELHRVTVEVIDVNDHPPTFQKEHLKFEISESALIGSRFVLESADDPDVEQNTLQSYFLTPNDYFVLKEHTNPDGSKYAEMVMQKALDREEQPKLSLKLVAVDGGNPQRSGTVNIDVTVLDVNDNAPVFNQTVYRASVVENASKGTYITKVNATDADSGSNGEIMFYFSKLKGNVADVFNIDEDSGIVSVLGQVDYEKDKKYEIRVEAKDQGGLTDSCKIIIEVMDVNDNAPIITIMSFSSFVSEDAPPGTTVAVIKIKDYDSDVNGLVKCVVNKGMPFEIRSSITDYYNLISDAYFDRETIPEYNITLTATDSGSPPLSGSATLRLIISDVNDNAPSFDMQTYSVYVPENNSPGLSLYTVSARDSDWHQNARVSYFLVEQEIGGTSVSSLVSINAETGVLHALHSFDYEQVKRLTFYITAQDGGSPPLTSNATIHVLIQDQNDNAPQILYPVQTGGSVVAEMVPRSADVGYLVTKVVAVDVDSGQNAWLSYKLHKATDRALFEVGLQNGEIRTVRQVTDKDAVKQKLTVVVEDNGQPSRSATVNVNVAVADTFPEVLSEFTDFTHKEYNDNLTFYLVLALAVMEA
ncbi:protocadherin beta-11-like [Neoarius graeffei]|uniref:protocadherin beta-11-like n=1 Tax=Neoarius graeffei TaxID=443677 RepID=UPI00298CCBD3|nr:protocadherin beta-11-like [Neoarius graeffei]